MSDLSRSTRANHPTKVKKNSHFPDILIRFFLTLTNVEISYVR